MKYKYSEKYQEAAILSHKGLSAIQAAEKLWKNVKTPLLSIIVKSGDEYICYALDGVHYGKLGDFCFRGFGAACLGDDNNYSDVINRYKIKTL